MQIQLTVLHKIIKSSSTTGFTSFRKSDESRSNDYFLNWIVRKLLTVFSGA